MAKAKEPKPRKPPAGSHTAAPLVSAAIKELVKTKARAAVLRKRAALLQAIIEKGGCGSAHGYRTYISHTCAGQRWVRVKEAWRVALVKIPGP